MKQKLKTAVILAILSILSIRHVCAEEAQDWFYEGNKLSKEGRYADAVEAYQRSLKLNSNSTVVYYNLGLAYKKLRNYKKAVEALEKTVELEPEYYEAHLALGNIYNLQEQWEDAIAHLNLVVHAIPDNAEAHGNLGWAYYNYKSDPPFKMLVIANLEKAVQLFEEQGATQAAEATGRVLDEALKKFGLDTGD